MKRSYILITTLILAACSQSAPENTGGEQAATATRVELSDAQIKNAGIKLAKPRVQTISPTIRLNGLIAVPPQNTVSVNVPLGGYVQSNRLMPGMYISKGAVMAVIQDPQYIQLQQDYLTARAQIGFAEAEYLRQRDLNQSKASSDKVYQQARVNFESQRILLKSLAEKLKLIGIDAAKLTVEGINRSITLKAPISGYVTAVNVNTGKYVSPTDVLYELVNPARIYLTLQVFEREMPSLFVGQKLFAYSNNTPEKKYICRIESVSRDFSADKSVTVNASFEKYDAALIPGMYMNAEVELKSKETHVLPEEAILSYESKQYVFVAESPSVFNMSEIKTGATENGYTEVFINQAVNAQSSVVVKGAYSLLMKLKNTEEE